MNERATTPPTNTEHLGPGEKGSKPPGRDDKNRPNWAPGKQRRSQKKETKLPAPPYYVRKEYPTSGTSVAGRGRLSWRPESAGPRAGRFRELTFITHRSRFGRTLPSRGVGMPTSAHSFTLRTRKQGNPVWSTGGLRHGCRDGSAFPVRSSTPSHPVPARGPPRYSTPFLSPASAIPSPLVRVGR